MMMSECSHLHPLQCNVLFLYAEWKFSHYDVGAIALAPTIILLLQNATHHCPFHQSCLLLSDNVMMVNDTPNYNNAFGIRTLHV